MWQPALPKTIDLFADLLKLHVHVGYGKDGGARMTDEAKEVGCNSLRHTSFNLHIAETKIH